MKFTKIDDNHIAVLVDVTEADAADMLARYERAALDELETPAKFISCLKKAKKKQEKTLQQQTKTEKMLRQATVCKLFREWQELTIEGFAQECGISKATVSRCENGKGSLGLTEFFLKKLCRRAGWSWTLFMRLVFDEDVDAVKQDAYA